MALTDSKIDEENNLTRAVDNYKSGAGATNDAPLTDAPTASRTFDKIGTAAAEYNDQDTGITNGLENSPADFNDVAVTDSPLSWIIPLALLFLLVIIGYAFCGGAPTE